METRSVFQKLLVCLLLLPALVRADFLDDGSRPNETLAASADWTNLVPGRDRIKVLDNHFATEGTNTSVTAYTVPDPGTADVFVSADVPNLAGRNGNYVIACRLVDSSNLIGAGVFANGQAVAVKRVANALTVFATSGTGTTSVRLECEGTTIRWYRNGEMTPWHTETVTDFAGETSVGLRSGSVSVDGVGLWDNFETGPLVEPPGVSRFAPFTVELQDSFADGITDADTEKGQEAIWTSTADTGTTVAENSGNLRITSNGATSVHGRIQTKPDFRNNFFVQPLKFTFTALDFIGTPIALPEQEEFLFQLTSTEEKYSASPDGLLLAINGNGDVELSVKEDAGASTSIISDTPAFVPTGATLWIDETSLFLHVFTATQQATYPVQHTLDAANWGARGDSALSLSAHHNIGAANGQTAIVVLGAFRVENLKFVDGFDNGVIAAPGHSRGDVWTNAGAVTESASARVITGVGSSVSPLSKDFNFFGQQLKFRVKLARDWAGSVSATNKIRFAINSQAGVTSASHDSFAIAFSPDSGGRIKAGWKTNSTSAVPEDTNVVLNLTGINPASFELTMERDDYSIAAYNANGVAIDLNGAAAGTTLTGTHNILWYQWQLGTGTPPPATTANSAIVLENTGGFGSTVSSWDLVQVERLDPYYLTPTVYGPIADGMELEVSGGLDPDEHPLLAKGFVDVTKAPFLADVTGVIDATNALNHAANFALENYLFPWAPCNAEFLFSDRIIAWQPLQWRTSHTSATARPNNAEEGPPGFVGESNCVTPPKLVLAPNSPGYGSAGTIKPAIQFWARNYNSYPTLVNSNLPGILFNGHIRGIDFDLTAAGNDGAFAISMQGAQGTTIEDVSIDASGAYTGISGLIGGGGAMVNVNVEATGAVSCIHGVGGAQGAGGSLMQPTITGLTCNGAPPRYDGFQTLVLVGADITVPDGTSCVNAGGGTGSGGVLLGMVSMVDSVCRWPSAAGANNAIDTDSSFYVKNSYFINADNIAVSGAGDMVSGNPTGCNHVIEAAKGIDPGVYTPPTPDAQYLHTRYEDGTRILAGTDLLEEENCVSPPGDLQSRHLPPQLPAWETMAIPAGLLGDFSASDSTTIQAHVTANDETFLPRGIYGVTSTLSTDADDLILGAGRTFTQLVAMTGSFDNVLVPEPIIQTGDDAAPATVLLADMMLNAQDRLNGGYAINWRTGAGMIRNLDLSTQSQYGFGTVPGQGTSVDKDWQMALFSGNAGGKIYDMHYGDAFNHAKEWRHFLIDGTSTDIHFYHWNPEHAHGECNVEIRNSQNVHIYGMKAEANLPILCINDSDNVNLYGFGGNAAAFEPDDDYDDDPPDSVDDPTKGPFDPTWAQYTPTLFRVTNTPNWRLVGLFDQVRLPDDPEVNHLVFGHGQPPENWHFALEVAPGEVDEILVPALDRPILMRRQAEAAVEGGRRRRELLSANDDYFGPLLWTVGARSQ